MPSTKSSRSSGSVLDPVGDLAQRIVEEEVPGAEHPVLDLVQPRAEAAGLEAHHLARPAVEEDGVAHLVDELGGEEGLDLPAWRREQERRQVRGDPLLPDVEAADAEGGVPLRLPGADQPMLAVDGEVELVRAPVLSLPEGVELLVVQQPTLRAPALGRVAGVSGGPAGRHLAAPASGVLGLDAALALLALQLRAVDALGPVDPAPEQGDRRNAALDLGLAESHRVGRGQLAGEQLEPVRVAEPDECIRVLAEAALDPHGAVVDLDAPGSPSLTDQLVGDSEAVAACPLGLDRVGQRAEDKVRVDRVAEPGELARAGVRDELAESERLAAASTQLQPAAHQRADRVAPGGDPRERLGVGGDRKGLAIEIRAGEHLGHLGPAAEGADGPGADALELEAIAEPGREASPPRPGVTG